MKKAVILYISSFFLLVLIMGCKKEKTTWSTDWSAPLVRGTLKLDDLVDTTFQKTNTEGYISLVYNESIYTFSIDTLISLPDTTISTKTAFSFPVLTVTPDFTFTENHDQLYDLEEIALKKVRIKSGEMQTSVSTPWSGKSTFDFSFPNVGENGTNLARSYNMDPGSIANPYTITDIIDLSGQLMDMRGSDGNQINTIEGLLTISSNEETKKYTVTDKDSITFSITFEDLIPDYALGYFGNHTFSDTTSVKLPYIDRILEGAIDLDSIKLNLFIRNGFNLIAQGRVTQLTGINSKTKNAVALNFPAFNEVLNINPASGGIYDYTPSNYLLEINNTNSNVLEFVENLSDSVRLGFEMEINPFGNISGGTDEFYPDSRLELYMEAEFPLSFGANGLTLADTFKIDYEQNPSARVEKSEITMFYSNGFPLEASTEIWLLNDSGLLLDKVVSEEKILSGSFDATNITTSPSSGIVKFDLNENFITSVESGGSMLVYIKLSSENGGKVKLTPNDFFDFKINSDLNIKLTQ